MTSALNHRSTTQLSVFDDNIELLEEIITPAKKRSRKMRSRRPFGQRKKGKKIVAKKSSSLPVDHLPEPEAMEQPKVQLVVKVIGNIITRKMEVNPDFTVKELKESLLDLCGGEKKIIFAGRLLKDETVFGDEIFDKTATNIFLYVSPVSFPLGNDDE